MSSPVPFPQRFLAALCLALALAGAAPVAAEQPQALRRATLMPVWYPQSQFAGYYVALAKGIYARHGIDLTIRPASAGLSSVQALESGEVDFAVLWLSTAIKHRSEGKPLRHLAQVIQRSSMMLVARKSAGIGSVADMAGRKVGLWPGELSIPPRALFAREAVTVREVPQAYTVNLFLRGGIDVASAMSYNEYHTILMSGLDEDELDVFRLSELGVKFPEDGLYALQSTVESDPALVADFVRASMEGWQYAFDHPEEALEVIIGAMREANLPANRVHQKWMLDRMRELAAPGAADARPGELDREDYEAVVQSMREVGLLGEQAPDYDALIWRADAGQK